MSNKKINCLKCKYYYVTWDASAAHGCKIIAFKSHIIPSLVVLKNTGMKCQMFEDKFK